MAYWWVPDIGLIFLLIYKYVPVDLSLLFDVTITFNNVRVKKKKKVKKETLTLQIFVENKIIALQI